MNKSFSMQLFCMLIAGNLSLPAASLSIASLQKNFNTFKRGILCTLSRKVCTAEEKEAVWTAGKILLGGLAVVGGTTGAVIYVKNRMPKLTPAEIDNKNKIIAIINEIVQAVQDSQAVEWEWLKNKLEGIKNIKKENEQTTEKILAQVRQEKESELQNLRDNIREKKSKLPYLGIDSQYGDEEGMLQRKWDMIYFLQGTLNIKDPYSGKIIKAVD
jgi:hypothetical protein